MDWSISWFGLMNSWLSRLCKWWIYAVGSTLMHDEYRKDQRRNLSTFYISYVHEKRESFDHSNSWFKDFKFKHHLIPSYNMCVLVFFTCINPMVNNECEREGIFRYGWSKIAPSGAAITRRLIIIGTLRTISLLKFFNLLLKLRLVFK